MTRARANGQNQLVTKRRDRSNDNFTDERNDVCKILSYTIADLFCQQLRLPQLHFAQLLTD
jgi:hypothetical protein